VALDELRRIAMAEHNGLMHLATGQPVPWRAQDPASQAERKRKFDIVDIPETVGAIPLCADCGLSWYLHHKDFYCIEGENWRPGARPLSTCKAERYHGGEHYRIVKSLLEPLAIDYSKVPIQSQFQQYETKEETVKAFAVLFHDHTASSSGGSLQFSYETEQEARDYVAAAVAKTNANATLKFFFTYTIVNTQTGKLVASFVQAPPALVWTNEGQASS
jgi:hypothetical protein